MLRADFKKLFDLYPGSDWIIDEGVTLPALIQNKDYVDLICKQCGHKKRHSVGNIKHTLLKDRTHSCCTKCSLIRQQKITSENIIKRAELTIASIPHCSWFVDRSRLDQEQLYNHKSPLPLLCNKCNTTVDHSLSNLNTCLQNPLHIQCQECKVRNTWALKTSKRSKGEYVLDTHKTNEGFKIIHTTCSNYYYVNNPNLTKKYKCPFCASAQLDIIKLRDLEQVRLFFSLKTKNRLTVENFDFSTRILSISCNEHPEQGTYELAWTSFQHSINNGRTYCCRLCRKQRLRTTTAAAYNDKIEQLSLSVDESIKGKLDLSEEILHRCTAAAHHPTFYASPYQVFFKNKRCLYCVSNVSYHKDYDFMKTYIEMDEDRFFTHSGKKFRLLSSREEIEQQIRPQKHLGSVKIRLKELTCELHDSYEITWGSFYYRHIACGKCNKESNLSYAHCYYQALLEYFKMDYIPEYPIKIDGKTTYRADFKLLTTPNYLEIDSNLHVSKGWDRTNMEAYKQRDEVKNKLLEGNLERIKLYDEKKRVLPTNIQLKIIEQAFIQRAVINGLHITEQNILEAKRDKNFFKSARIAGMIKRLAYYHGDHIELKAKKHIDILHARRSNNTEFYCTVNRESFIRNAITVFSFHFLCPICAKKIQYGRQSSYRFNEAKLLLIKEQVSETYKKRFDLSGWSINQIAFFYLTVVFPVYDNYLSKEIYLTLRDLMENRTAAFKNKISKNRHLKKGAMYPKLIESARIRKLVEYKEVPTANIDADNRIMYNKRSSLLLDQYQKNAKKINKEMKINENDAHIDHLIIENEKPFRIFIHRTKLEAQQKLSVYDRKIIPFFAEQPNFELQASRQKYACNKQFLLIKDKRCGHLFYLSWSWINVRKKKGSHPIQCQRKKCFHQYYLTRNPEPRKIAQSDLLQIFNDRFHGQYYPAHPEKKIMVREPIVIVHLPSGKQFTASVDNFRRGKFRCAFKNMSLKEIGLKFPAWNTEVKPG